MAQGADGESRMAGGQLPQGEMITRLWALGWNVVGHGGFSGVGGMIPGPAHSQASFGSRRLWSAFEHPGVPGVGGLGPAGPRRLVQRTSFVATAKLHGVAPGCTQRHTQPADVAACRFVPRPHETGSRPAGAARVTLGCPDRAQPIVSAHSMVRSRPE